MTWVSTRRGREWQARCLSLNVIVALVTETQTYICFYFSNVGQCLQLKSACCPNTKLNDTWISPVRGYVTHGLKQHSEYTFCTCLCYDVLILSIIHGTLKVMHKKNKLVHKNSSHCRKLSVWHSKSWFMLLMFLFFSHWRWQP